MTQEIELDPEQALARGRDRLVFQHPRHSDRVIKVMRPRYAAMHARRAWIPPFSRTRRFGALKHVAWEVGYYLECCAQRPADLRLMPEIHGFEPTNLGLGLVCEKIDDGAGGLAPTLAAVAKGPGLDARARRLLAEFAAALEAGHFVFRDVNPRNIVLAPDRAVVVDGFGDIRPVPLRRLSVTLNRYLLRRDLRRLRDRFGF